MSSADFLLESALLKDKAIDLQHDKIKLELFYKPISGEQMTADALMDDVIYQCPDSLSSASDANRSSLSEREILY